MRLTAFAYLLTFFMVNACTYDKVKLPDPAPLIEEDSTLKITYVNYVKKVIDNKCVSCHSPGGLEQPYLTNYNEVFSFKERVKARAIDNTPSAMPPYNPLEQSIKDTLQLWIDQGALEQ